MTSTAPPPTLQTAIIGAGFGGLAMAQGLLANGDTDFVIFEKADAVGGTWRDNDYPGAACDVPSHLYSLSSAPRSDWSRLFPRQPELRAHLESMAAPLQASGQIQTGHRLVRARWLDEDSVWALDFDNGQYYRAHQLILALGGLHVPAFPDIPGLADFAGDCFHSARWQHGVPLAGRRVGVIGNGASAVQFVPQIAPQVAQLTIFQRTANWLLPRTDFGIAPFWQRAFARLPWLRLALRGSIFCLLEILLSGLTHRRSGFWASWLARRHLRRQVADPTLRAKLTPDYPVGCKRILISSDYYPALQLPQVELVDDAIERIETNGVRLADGRLVELDVLILGTGFRPLDVLTGLSIEGREERSLAADWASRPQAHLGISPHGYPNLHFLLGPNTALGHNSVLYMIESQVRHILRLHALRRVRGASSVEATAQAQGDWMAEVDRGFAASAWAGGCQSWYLDSDGVNIALWTRSCLAYRWRTRRPRPSEYVFGTTPRTELGVE